jgi:CubicO group peptidase (beta-lactamase class C family)
MRPTHLFVLLAFALGCARRHDGRRPANIAPAQQTARDAELRKRILAALPEVDEMVKSAFEKGRVPSLTAAVLIDGETVWWRVLGTRDLEGAGPATRDTAYRIGSVTKVVTAMAALKLRDEGRLALDQPAADFLPELDAIVYPTADSPIITIRHLLTHTSGLPRLGRFDYAANRAEPVSEREVLAALVDLRLEHAPGTHWEYSNFAYGLLGIVIGRAAGEPYRDYVSRTIFAPLGMRAVWDWTAIPSEHRAMGYERLDSGEYRKSHEWLFGASEGMGGIYASLDDMARFLAFQMTAWPAGARPDGEPLSNASLREAHMMGGLQRPGRMGTGMGWGVVDFGDVGHSVFHTGATTTFGATAMFSPNEGIGFVALTNCGQHSGTIDGLAGSVLAALTRAAKRK